MDDILNHIVKHFHDMGYHETMSRESIASWCRSLASACGDPAFDHHDAAAELAMEIVENPGYCFAISSSRVWARVARHRPTSDSRTEDVASEEETVRRAFECLTDGETLLARMFFVEGMSVEEVSDLTGESLRCLKEKRRVIRLKVEQSIRE